ncbi:hypothetical protein MIR68_001693 [Amoeboaphelidium protococcarum]|nr:hypothetical protein MIR68_001693 [Amoeboaphelidium protococcarum]
MIKTSILNRTLGNVLFKLKEGFAVAVPDFNQIAQPLQNVEGSLSGVLQQSRKNKNGNAIQTALNKRYIEPEKADLIMLSMFEI